tara:strand:+ start:1114 stop:1440 length:327 start_codon:yes stop_codon:yes gene_type:complete
MFYITHLIILIFLQNIDPYKFLDGKWCESKDKECFYLKSEDGLIIYEDTDGGFRTGVEIVNYDKKEKKIYWRIVGTSKKTQYFKILKGTTVEHFDGINTKKIKKFKVE